jgi:4-diphosphocytidyl-2C-methyl-D-erythritol kinase
VRARAQVIDLGDTLDFTPLPGARRDELTCDMPGVPTDGSNLVVKARRLCGPRARHPLATDGRLV